MEVRLHVGYKSVDGHLDVGFPQGNYKMLISINSFLHTFDFLEEREKMNINNIHYSIVN